MPSGDHRDAPRYEVDLRESQRSLASRAVELAGQSVLSVEVAIAAIDVNLRIAERKAEAEILQWRRDTGGALDVVS